MTLLGLLHPVPSAATVLAAGGCAVLLVREPPAVREYLGRLGLLLSMVALQQAAISLHNDWSDRALDAAAKPWRALPRGLIAAGRVRTLAWALAAASVAAAVPLGWDEVALDLAGAGAGFAYNAGLKGTRWSWLPFAVAFPLLPLFGAAALDVWPPAWWTLFVVGAPAVVAIHLADTLPDLERDAAAGVHGLAHRLGARGARRASLAALAGAAGAAVLGAGLAGAASDAGPAGSQAQPYARTLVGLGAPAAGAALGVLCAAVAWRWPAAHRVAVTAGAAAVALGWVAAVARAAR